MKLIIDETYEDLAAEWQYIEIARLAKVLKKHGIVDAAIRKEICGDYFFDSGNHLDSESIEVEGAQYSPQLVFSPLDDGNDCLHLPNDEFAFHEYAFGNVDAVFESEEAT